MLGSEEEEEDLATQILSKAFRERQERLLQGIVEDLNEEHLEMGELLITCFQPMSQSRKLKIGEMVQLSVPSNSQSFKYPLIRLVASQDKRNVGKVSQEYAHWVSQLLHLDGVFLLY